jgi:hypothetical protein
MRPCPNRASQRWNNKKITGFDSHPNNRPGTDRIWGRMSGLDAWKSRGGRRIGGAERTNKRPDRVRVIEAAMRRFMEAWA